MSENLDINVNVNTTQAQRNLTTLNKQVNTLSTSFEKLKTALGSLALGGLVMNAVRYADAIQDLSDATGIATGTIVGFQTAIKQSGGEVEGAQKGLLKFAESIQEAADGGKKAQVDFEKVGITLQDLQTLSEEDLLKRTVDGLSQITDTTQRLATATALFGKGAKGVNFSNVAGSMAASTNESAKFASAISSAAAAQQSLEDNMRNLTTAILQVIEPLTKLVSTINISVDDFSKLIKILGTAAAAYLLFTRGLGAVTSTMNTVMTSLRSGGAVFAWFIAQFKSIGNNFYLFFKNVERLIINVGVALGIFAKGAGTAAGAMGSMAAMAANVLRVFLRFAGVAGVIITVAEAFEFLEKKIFGTNYVGKGLEYIAIALEKMTEAFGKLLNMPTNIIGKILGIDNPTGLGDPLIALAKKAEEARKGLDSSAGAGRGNAQLHVEMLRKQQEEQDKAAKKTREVEDAFAKQRTQIELSALAFRRQNDELVKALNLESQLVGKSEDYAEVQRAIADVQKRAADEIQRLRDAKAALAGDDKKLASVYDAQIAKIQEQTKVDQERIVKAVEGLQAVKLLEQDRVNNIERINQALQKQATYDESILQIRRQAQDALSQAQFEGQQMTRTPLEQKIEEIKRSAELAAREAGRAFAQQFEGMELTTQDAQRLADGLDLIAQKYKAISDAQLANLEASRSFATGWKNAFDQYMDNATNAAQRAGEVFRSVTSNMESAIDKFVETGKFSFSDFARSVIQDLIKIELKAQATKLIGALGGGGGIFSAIGSLFGFAEGGSPPVNKPSIVGEKGPELFVPKTAGTVVPNNQMGKMGGTTNNTYITNNISAIDSKSVAQLFAENRKTLLGTVQLAQKEMPYGSR